MTTYKYYLSRFRKVSICKNLLNLYEDFKMKSGKRKIDEISPKEDESQKMNNNEEEETETSERKFTKRRY